MVRGSNGFWAAAIQLGEGFPAARFRQRWVLRKSDKKIAGCKVDRQSMRLLDKSPPRLALTLVHFRSEAGRLWRES